MNGLPPAAQRVQDAADALSLGITVRIMEQATRTAEEAAIACSCLVGQIVKSLIFKGKDSGSAYLLLVSGANRVDEDIAAAALGEAIARPDAAFVREATGFAIGGIRRSATALSPAWTATCCNMRRCGRRPGRPIRSSRSTRNASGRRPGRS